MKSIIFCMVTFFCTLNAHPKVVAKFGSSASPGSEQLKNDIWSSSSFRELLKGASIEMEESTSEEQHGVGAVLVVVASDGEEIGQLGYLFIPAEKYVQLIQEMVFIHTLSPSISHMTPDQLLHLYRKAQVFQMKKMEEQLLQEGLAKETGVDFLIEQYARSVKTHPRKAQQIKRSIRARKCFDARTEWEIALIAFEARKERLLSASMIISPLEKFLRDFESTHPEYGWRCHLVLAQFYQEQKQMEKMRFHAARAAQGAPDELKSMVSLLGEDPS